MGNNIKQDKNSTPIATMDEFRQMVEDNRSEDIENEECMARIEEDEHYADYSDQEYDKASSNKGELI